MNGHDLHIYHQGMDKSGYFRWRTLPVTAAGETHTQGVVIRFTTTPKHFKNSFVFVPAACESSIPLQSKQTRRF